VIVFGIPYSSRYPPPTLLLLIAGCAFILFGIVNIDRSRYRHEDAFPITLPAILTGLFVLRIGIAQLADR